MFKKIFSISIIFAYTLIIGANTFAFLYFKINQHYIAENLCIQKDEAENLCMGSCYLKAIQKRLHEDEKSEKGTQAPAYKAPVQFETTLNHKINLSTIAKKGFLILIKNDTPLERAVEPLTPPPKSV